VPKSKKTQFLMAKLAILGFSPDYQHFFWVFFKKLFLTDINRKNSEKYV
jgi:hypothetical protein